MRPAGVVAALLAAILATGLPLAGQGQAQPPTFRSTSNIVDVHVTVRTRAGVFAQDLTKDDFELYEDGKQREIDVFSTELRPVSVAIVLDRSGSVDAEFENVTIAARDFLSVLLRGDRASVSTLRWDCQPLTDNLLTLMAALKMPLPDDGGSPIWSATARAISSLAGEPTRRAVLLFSDGDDTSNLAFPAGTAASIGVAKPKPDAFRPCVEAQDVKVTTVGALRRRAEAEGVMVYTVSVDGADLNGVGHRNLTEIAEDSGGERYRLGSYAELRTAFRRIGEELHLQYLLGFTPTKFDGQRHEIEVRAKRPGVTVRSRRAYVANK